MIFSLINQSPLRIRRKLPSWQGFGVKIVLSCLILFGGTALLYGQNESPTNDKTAPENLIYEWERVYYGKINNEQRLLYTGTFARMQMSFADIDGDGDEDLMVGKADGHLAFFENTGKHGSPNFELKTEYFQALHLESGEAGEPQQVEKVIDVGANAAPTFVDIDTDGDLDLFIGSRDGTIFYYQNEGNTLLPIFALKEPAYMSLRPGNDSVPRFKDINTDRAADLLVGTRQGKIYLYKNAGIPTQALFCSEARKITVTEHVSCRFPRETIGNIFPEIDASPTWVDWNYDGLWDIAVGKASGQISFYYNKGTAFEPQWDLESERFLFIDAGGYASPLFYDLNGDGFSELLVGTSTTSIVYYENREVLQTGLKKIQELDLSGIDWKDDHLTILEKACAQLNGAPACLPALERAFRISEEVEQNLEAYADFIVRSKTRGASEPLQDGNGEAPQEATAEPPAARLLERLNNPLVPAQALAPDGTVAETGQATATPSDSPQGEATFPRARANRNHLWMADRNFLNFGHFLHGDRRAMVTSGDWDGDGDGDLLLGSESGKLFAYENIGTTRAPNWRQLRLPVFRANQRSNSAPNLVDIDGDGDLDILVGNRLGKLELITNSGSPTQPDWNIESLSFADIDVGSNSVPTFLDIDGDEDLDLFVGNSKGRIIFYENIGRKDNARYSLKSTQFANLVDFQNIAPSFFSWNADNNMDLIIGGREGQIALLSHNHLEGTPWTQGWNLEDENWNQIETAGFSAPHVTDFNQDQNSDLLIGDLEGNVTLWLNRGFIEEGPVREEPSSWIVNNSLEQAGEEGELGEDSELEELPAEEVDLPFDPQYVLVTKQFLPLPNDRRIVPAFFDSDADGDLDIVIGTKEGLLYHFLNEGTPGEPQWTVTTKRFLEYQSGQNATPVFADVDQDGDQDFLVSNDRGQLSYWENQGTLDFSEFVKNPTLFQGVTGGVNSRPAFVDINQDGLLDLLIGNFRGQLVHYLQRVNASGRDFQLIHRRYLGLDLGIGATPTVTDLNNDKSPDLVIGSDHGQILAYQPVPIEQDPERWGWQPGGPYFDALKVPLGNFPVFADIDQDGDQDLFVGGDGGSNDGNFYYYRNDGKPRVANSTTAQTNQ